MRTLILAIAAASALSTPAVAQDTPEGGAWTDCAVASVALLRDRLVVKCGGLAGADAPRMFAMESSDRLLDPVLRIALDAKAPAWVRGRRLPTTGGRGVEIGAACLDLRVTRRDDPDQR
jgi:hypothetical protein